MISLFMQLKIEKSEILASMAMEQIHIELSPSEEIVLWSDEKSISC